MPPTGHVPPRVRHLHGTCAVPDCTFLFLFSFGLSDSPRLGCSPVPSVFAKGSCGKMTSLLTRPKTPRNKQHIRVHAAARGTWRHVSHRRFGVPAHRMVSVPSGSASPIQSYYESTWTNPQTHKHNPAKLSRPSLEFCRSTHILTSPTDELTYIGRSRHN